MKKAKALLGEFIAGLEDAAKSNEKISQKGSPMTSMAEDSCLGEIAEEQRRIAAKLKLIKKEMGNG